MLDKINQKKPLPQIVADRIITLIETKELLPQDKLPSEQELMKELDVGRGTIREAIKILVSRNIVEIHRGVGTFVSTKTGVVDDPLGFSFIDDKEKLVKDSMNVRALLEPSIAMWAAKNASDDDIEEIWRLCDGIEQAILNHKDYSDLDVQFHAKIANSCSNVVVKTLIPVLNTNIRSLIDVSKASLKQETIETHKAIANAIASRDGLQAYQAMKDHIAINQKLLAELFGD